MPEYPAVGTIVDPNAVHKTGDEVITGVKSFASAPAVPADSWTEDDTLDLVADLADRALDADVVHKATANADIGLDGLDEDRIANLVADLAAKATTATYFVADLFANRPAAGVAHRLFACTDVAGDHVGQWFRDDGAAWHEVLMSEHAAVNDPAEFIDIRAIGVDPANSDVDNTSALQDLIDTAPIGLIIKIPSLPDGAQIEFTTLTIATPITIAGGGWHSVPGSTFGDAVWSTTSNYGGSVLKSTTTTSSAITFAHPTIGGFGFGLRDLMVLGPGSGTSTGVTIGSTSHGSVGSHVSNVLVANFALGWDFIDVEDSTMIALRARGCSTGFRLQEATNQNEWLSTEVQFSTIDAILVTSGPTQPSVGNHFRGGLIQNCSGYGIHDDGTRGTTDNHFDGFWFEANTTTESVWLEYAVGAGAHSVTDCHFSNGDSVRVGALGCTVGPNWWSPGSGPLTVDNTANGFRYVPGSGEPDTFSTVNLVWRVTEYVPLILTIPAAIISASGAGLNALNGSYHTGDASGVIPVTAAAVRLLVEIVDSGALGSAWVRFASGLMSGGIGGEGAVAQCIAGVGAALYYTVDVPVTPDGVNNRHFQYKPAGFSAGAGALNVWVVGYWQ